MQRNKKWKNQGTLIVHTLGLTSFHSYWGKPTNCTSVAHGSLAQTTFGAIRSSFTVRIRKVPVQRFGEVLEGSSADT